MTVKIQQIEFRAMGSEMLAAVRSDRPEVAALLEEVPRWFAEWEETLSRFREESELSRLNRSGSDRPVVVSDTLWKVLKIALEAAHNTDGMITPTVLGAVEAAGYTASFDVMQHDGLASGRDAELQGAAKSAFRATTGRMAGLIEGKREKEWRNVKMNAGTQTVKLPVGVGLDLGGVAKGWAADEAAHRLAQLGPCIVNAGGDIAMAGTGLESCEWLIGVMAPSAGVGKTGEGDETELELLAIEAGGLATSGRDYRKWKQGEEWKHHIIDPRTGAPSKTDVMTATVVAPSAYSAEVGAKMAFLLGSRAGLEWIEERPSLAALMVLEDGRVIRSSRLDRFVWSDKSGISVEEQAAVGRQG
jgi:thiamine biosynthesis lipoprotein